MTQSLALLIRVLIAGLTFVTLLLSSSNYILSEAFSIWFVKSLAPAMLIFTFAKHGIENFYYLELRMSPSVWRVTLSFLIVYSFIGLIVGFVAYFLIEYDLLIIANLVILLGLSSLVGHFLRARELSVAGSFVDAGSLPAFFALLIVFGIEDIFIYIAFAFTVCGMALFGTVFGQKRTRSNVENRKWLYASRSTGQVSWYVLLSLVSATSGWGILGIAGSNLTEADSSNLAALLRAGAIITFGQGALTSYFAPMFSHSINDMKNLNAIYKRYRQIALKYVGFSSVSLGLLSVTTGAGANWIALCSLFPVIIFFSAQVFNVMVGPVLFLANLFSLEKYTALGAVVCTTIAGLLLWSLDSGSASTYVICSVIQTVMYTIFCAWLLRRKAITTMFT